MNDVKEISLLPINSYELEGHLTEIGSSLVQFGKARNFSQLCVGVGDCDFLQSVVIEFTAEIKTDFISYYAIHQAALPAGTSVTIRSEEHSVGVMFDAAINASERKLNVVHPRLSFSFCFWTKRVLESTIYSLKTFFYYQRNAYNNRKTRSAPIPSQTPGKFRLLMSTYHSNTIFTLTPVQDRLKNRHDVTQLYIANRYETFQRLVGLGYPGIISGWSIRTHKEHFLNDQVLKSFLTEYFQFHFPYGEATSFFKTKFYKKLKQKILFLIRLYSPMQKVLSKFQPHMLLISSCSTSDAQLLIHLCDAKKIRVIEMTHGMFQDTPLLEFQNVPLKLVWCKRQQDIMNKYKPDMMCPIVGNPKHDDLLAKFEQNKPLRIISRPYILFASTPGNNVSISWITYLRILKDYIFAAQQFPELDFIIKLHPSEDLDEIRKEANAAGAPINLKLNKDSDVYELLYHAEIVMVLTSTVGFEALLWNKKIICYIIPNSDKWLPFADFGLAKAAANEKELVNSIHFFLQNDSLTINNPNRDYFVFSDGKAIEKILSYTLESVPA